MRKLGWQLMVYLSAGRSREKFNGDGGLGEKLIGYDMRYHTFIIHHGKI